MFTEVSEVLAERRVQLALSSLVRHAMHDAGMKPEIASRVCTNLMGKLESGAPYQPAIDVVAYVCATLRSEELRPETPEA